MNENISSYSFEDDDEYDKRCGEIYLSAMGRMTFHCTFCGNIYPDFKKYAAHIDDHLYDNDNEQSAEYLSDVAVNSNLNTYEESDNIGDFDEKVDNKSLDGGGITIKVCRKKIRGKKEKKSSSPGVPGLFEGKTENNRSEAEIAVKLDSDVISNKEQEHFLLFSEDEGLAENVSDVKELNRIELLQIMGAESVGYDVNKVETIDNEALDDEEIPIEILKKRVKSKKKTGPSPAVMKAFAEINSTSNAEAEFGTSFISNKQTEIRPIRKKTNYFPSENEIRPFKCDHCAATFKDPSCLSKHKARHRTEKTHPCPECPKMFYTHFDVKKHLTTHAGERPFLCNICGKTLISSVKLKDHMRRHTNQRDYECPECKKRFYNSSLLSSHKLVHKSEKSFECTFCDSRFTFKKGLRNHLKLHENKREYKCDICNADFNQKAGLFCHKKTKHQLG